MPWSKPVLKVQIARYFLIPVWQHKGNRIHHSRRYPHSMILRTVYVLVLESPTTRPQLENYVIVDK